jgi:hypothetical protein
MPADEYELMFANGVAAYEGGRDEEATLLYLGARAIATKHRDPIKAYEALVRAAESSGQTRDETRTLALLIEASESPPRGASQYEQWLAQWLLLSHHVRTMPNPARAQAQLDRMEALVGTLSEIQPSDVPLARAALAMIEGRWIEALEWAERAWSLHRDGLGGRWRSNAAEKAVHASLRCGRLADAERWLAVLGETVENYAVSRLEWHNCYFDLALATGRVDEAASLAVRMEADAVAMQGNKLNIVNENVVRALLVSRHDDPADPLHPSRIRMRRHRTLNHGLSVDYRLACVRWAAGIEPQDDYFHWLHPPRVPRVATAHDLDDFQRRVERAATADVLSPRRRHAQGNLQAG